VTVEISQPPESPAWPVTIYFTAANFTLMPPGTCPGGATNTACGHVQVVFVGDIACSGGPSPMGSVPEPYLGYPGECPEDCAVVDLSECQNMFGSHTVSLELHYDDGATVTGPGGAVISAQVTFTTTRG
jgi:hypothetical protein